MTIGQIAVLGLVQGLTEFLPVSSSGHLVLARLLLSIPDIAGTATDAFLHLGTLLAAIAYYWRVWWGIARGIFVRDEEGNDKRNLLGKIIVATIPAAIAGYLWAGAIDSMFRGITTLVSGFIITAAVLLWAERLRSERLRRVGWRQALIMGLAQVVALIPSVSRSGVTIAAARAQGLSRSQAVHFSFLMSVPIIAGAGLVSLPTLVQGQVHSSAVLITGLIVSFVSGLLGIHALVRVTQTFSFTPFAIYLCVLSALLIVLY